MLLKLLACLGVFYVWRFAVHNLAPGNVVATCFLPWISQNFRSKYLLGCAYRDEHTLAAWMTPIFPTNPTKWRANEQLGGGGSHQPFLDISSTPWMIITWDVLHTKQPSPPGWAYMYAEMSSFFNCWHDVFCSKDFLGLEQKRFYIKKRVTNMGRMRSRLRGCLSTHDN